MAMSKENEKSIQESINCYKSCSHTMTHCLEMGGEHAEQKHINLLIDCAKICILHADFMLRDSKFHGRIAEICAEICDACAESCDKFDDEFMKKCAEQCRRCADECRKMIKA
jgi:hypothetical protein